MKRTELERPYWVTGHEELCAGCEGSFSHAVEVRCVECDRPFCPVCIVFIDTEAWCRDCEPESRRR